MENDELINFYLIHLHNYFWKKNRPNTSGIRTTVLKTKTSQVSLGSS